LSFFNFKIKRDLRAGRTTRKVTQTPGGASTFSFGACEPTYNHLPDASCHVIAMHACIGCRQ
jgi:hypothetical protein